MNAKYIVTYIVYVAGGINELVVTSFQSKEAAQILYNSLEDNHLINDLRLCRVLEEQM